MTTESRLATDKLKIFAAYIPYRMEEEDWDPEIYSKVLLRDMAIEILASREAVDAELKGQVVEAAREVIESLNPMFIETDAVIVKLHDAIQKLDETRRG